MYFLITSLHLTVCLSFGSTHFHVLITTSSSVFFFTWPNHLNLASHMFSLMSATPALVLTSSFLNFSILFIPIIHVKIIIYVLSSTFFSAFLSVQVTLPRGGLASKTRIQCTASCDIK